MKQYLEIDTFLKKSKIFWQKLEIHCVAGCCGLDAFSFEEFQIIEALQNLDKTAIINNIEILILETSNTEFKNIYSRLFNSYETKTEFIKRMLNVLKIIYKQ